MDVSYFSLHNEKLVEVLYKRQHCSSENSELSLLCRRVVISVNDKPTDIPYYEPQVIEINDSFESVCISESELELYSDQRKLNTTVIENGSNELKLYDNGSEKIKDVLKYIGLVIENDKMYTMEPSQIFYYTHNITSYSPIRHYLSSPPNNSMNSPGSYYDEKRYHKPISSKFTSNNNFSYKLDENLNKGKKISRFKHFGNTGNDKKYRSNWNKLKINLPSKYWAMRGMLFAKFDEGILLDEESFYSVCPEILSYHIAKRCRNDVAMDPFCGAGGNIIQLAFTCKLVIAIDIDPCKIQFARNNAEIYGVADKIEFIVGDFFTISSMLKADVICMSPPWGGPEYSGKSFTLLSMCSNFYGGGFGIFDIVKTIAPNIAFHMPKTTNILECLWLARNFGKVEIEQNIINDRLNSITAYYGEFTNISDDDY